MGMFGYVVDMEVFNFWRDVGILVFTFIAAIAAGAAAKYTYRIMEATLLQARAAIAINQLQVDEDRHRKLMNAERIAAAFSWVDMQVSWVRGITADVPPQHAAKAAADQREYLERSAEQLLDVDELPMTVETRTHLREARRLLSLLAAACPRALLPGRTWVLTDQAAKELQDLAAGVGGEILGHTSAALTTLRAQMDTLKAATVTLALPPAP